MVVALGAGQVYDSIGEVSSTSGTTLPNSGTAHTKGAWTAIGSSPFVTAGFWIHFLLNSTTTYLVDVRAGGAGFVVENILISYLGNQVGASFWVPCTLAEGVSVEARQQCNGTTQTIAAWVTFVAADGDLEMNGGLIRTHGADLSVSQGTQVPGGSTNVTGSPVTMPLVRDGQANQNTTLEPYRAIALGMGTQGATSRPTIARHQIDVLVDSVVRLPVMFACAESNSMDILSGGMLTHIYPIHIPAGSTISIQQKVSASMTPNPTTIDFCVYGYV